MQNSFELAAQHSQHAHEGRVSAARLLLRCSATVAATPLIADMAAPKEDDLHALLDGVACWGAGDASCALLHVDESCISNNCAHHPRCRCPGGLRPGRGFQVRAGHASPAPLALACHQITFQIPHGRLQGCSPAATAASRRPRRCHGTSPGAAACTRPGTQPAARWPRVRSIGAPQCTAARCSGSGRHAWCAARCWRRPTPGSSQRRAGC